ncbi:MAG TPA: MerR family transcriptional regulator [Myxococcota bacterium]|jgi:DNA-binding transcriptional MerR regulator|nr:MerR family transcriptional regulator [Myxococcota bacterium]
MATRPTSVSPGRASRSPSASGASSGPTGQKGRTSRTEPGSGTVDDGKRYYRIGEVSRITGIKPYVLRYWESEFRWMAPQKSRSQQRLYRRRDIEVIQLIKRLLYEERFTIAGARRKLRELGVSRALEAPQLGLELRPEEGGTRERLRRIRAELSALRAML